MRNPWIKNCLVNLRAFFTTNLRQRDNESLQRIAKLEAGDLCLRRMSYYNLMTYFAAHPEEAGAYRQELDNLRQHGHWETFPYPHPDVPRAETVHVGHHNGMSFVLHDGKRLFFPHGTPIDTLRQQYHGYLHEECLLGRNDTEGRPHQYQSPCVQVEPGDVLFDIGAAEGIFALDNIETAGRVVLVESDPCWYEPLQATFAPWADKVTLVRKNIGTVDNDTTVTLATLLATYGETSSFVKMDIEGAEMEVMDAFLRPNDLTTPVKFSLATYHRQDDHRRLEEALAKAGFRTEASTGYMLFCEYDIPLPPFFRKGILRAFSK